MATLLLVRRGDRVAQAASGGYFIFSVWSSKARRYAVDLSVIMSSSPQELKNWIKTDLLYKKVVFKQGFGLYVVQTRN